MNNQTKQLNIVEQAKMLPSLQSGVKVTIPLALLPEYLELHGLKPISFMEPETVIVKREEVCGE